MSDHTLTVMFGELLATAFLQTWWFKIGTTVILTGGALVFFLTRIRNLKIQKDDLKRQVSERSELLEHAVLKEKKAREAAAQANRTKSLLLARINHEIRTPLNGVLGMASLMAETSLSEEQREYNDTIRESGDSLLKVVNDILLNDILEYSKVESGKMELEQKDFNIENNLEEVLDVFAGKAAQQGIELIYKVADNLPAQIIGDNLRLKQVLTNLVENSMKATRDGEILINVYATALSNSNSLELAFEVKDTGNGIDPDKVKQLNTRLNNNTQGASSDGVGLIISKKLVDLMGGTIRIESVPGEGTTVSFTIRTAPSLQAMRSNVADVAVLEGKRVLLVESNETLGGMLKSQLEQWKLVTQVVRSGKDALEILSGVTRIDLVLTDRFSTDLDAIALGQAIHERHAGLPVILLAPTGDLSAKQHPELFKAIVFKPLKRHLLSKQIRNCFSPGEASDGNDPQTTRQKLSSDFSEQHPLRILIAEDNLTNQKLAMKVLGKLGYKPDMANHGKEVLDMVSHKHYDLILMDVQMPEMDGLEASRMIRLCLSVQPVIIAMTANTLQGDREECLKAGMDDYISKPINLDELVNVLDKWSAQVNAKR